jgi:hypothetical protein
MDVMARNGAPFVLRAEEPMDLRDLRRQPFVKDLTRTRHMTTVSAVVLVTTFMPLLGLPNVDELRAFLGAMDGFSEARTHAITRARDDEAARERSARSVIAERGGAGDSTGLVDRVLTVFRPARQTDDTLDTAEILPLPAIEDPEFMEPAEDEEIVLPEVVEDLAEPEDELMEEDEPFLEEEEEF